MDSSGSRPGSGERRPVVKSTTRHRQRSLQEVYTAHLCYLLAFPDPTPEDYEKKTIPAQKEVPYFQPVDIRWRKLGEEAIELEGTAAKIIRQRYEGGIQIAECYFSIESPLSAEGFRKRLQVEDAIQQYVLRDPQALFEEYSISAIAKNSLPGFVRRAICTPPGALYPCPEGAFG